MTAHILRQVMILMLVVLHFSSVAIAQDTTRAQSEVSLEELARDVEVLTRINEGYVEMVKSGYSSVTNLLLAAIALLAIAASANFFYFRRRLEDEKEAVQNAIRLFADDRIEAVRSDLMSTHFEHRGEIRDSIASLTESFEMHKGTVEGMVEAEKHLRESGLAKLKSNAERGVERLRKEFTRKLDTLEYDIEFTRFGKLSIDDDYREIRSAAPKVLKKGRGTAFGSLEVDGILDKLLGALKVPKPIYPHQASEIFEALDDVPPKYSATVSAIKTRIEELQRSA